MYTNFRGKSLIFSFFSLVSQSEMNYTRKLQDIIEVLYILRNFKEEEGKWTRRKSWSGGVDHHCFVCCCINFFSVSLFYRNKGEWIFLCIP